MTIPNIGYKANSTYERDAIFDELEKMGYEILLPICNPNDEHIEVTSDKKGFSAYDCKGDGFKYYPSPESFLTAAREALKPKDTDSSDEAYLLKQQIEGLKFENLKWKESAGWPGTPYKERFQKISKIADELADNCNKLEAERKQMREQMANLERSRDRLRLRVAQLKGNAEPKRETPPKIVGRKYRVVDGAYAGPNVNKADILTLIEDDKTDAPWFSGSTVRGVRPERTCAGMKGLELLPEEPWTAEYGPEDRVWICGKVAKTSVENGVLVQFDGWAGLIDNPNQIRKA